MCIVQSLSKESDSSDELSLDEVERRRRLCPFFTVCLIAFRSDLTCCLVKGSSCVCCGVVGLESLLDFSLWLSLELVSDESLSGSLSGLDGWSAFCSDSKSRLALTVFTPEVVRWRWRRSDLIVSDAMDIM